jgi:hypothetical protein
LTGWLSCRAPKNTNDTKKKKKKRRRKKGEGEGVDVVRGMVVYIFIDPVIICMQVEYQRCAHTKNSA